MSMFASETTETLALPFDAPHTVTIQKLTGADIEKAQAEHLNATVAGRSPRGWAGLFQNALRTGTATLADAEKAQRDPLAGYDRSTIVRCGLKAWTYARELDAKAVADIDDDALEFLALAIMKLTKPWLFQTEEEAEAAQKNG
jgi:hypothetical protein